MKNKITYILAVLLSFSVLTSCENYLDINEDPNNPLVVPVSQLLPAAQLSMTRGVDMNTGLSLFASLYTHQVVQRGIAANDYAFDGQSFGVASPWTNIYVNALTNIRDMIRFAEEDGNTRYAGVAKLMKAYTFAVLVDIYGDVPYFEANQGSLQTNPVYDDDAAIYDDVLLLIDEAIADLSDPQGLVLQGDLIYGGNVDNWIAFGNTLKLRMYNQMRLVRDVSAQVTDLIDNQPLISTTGMDFQLVYGTSSAPDSRHPLYASEWAPSGSGFNISPYFYEVLMGMDTYGHGNDIFDGIEDPRIPYYFYNQMSTAESPENNASYWDTDTGFLGIHAFSFNIDPNEGFDQGASRTLVGQYPAGGRFDDGSGVNGNYNGTGDAPQQMLTNYMRLFIQAELALEGDYAGDHRAFLEAAIVEAFAKVNQIAGAAGSPTIANADRDAYVASILDLYDAGNNTEKLEIIMTQKWIASFGYAIDSYNDVRRTGFPMLYDGNTDDLETTVRTREFPTAYPWSLNDLNLNTNAPTQKNIVAYRVFWDN